MSVGRGTCLPVFFKLESYKLLKAMTKPSRPCFHLMFHSHGCEQFATLMTSGKLRWQHAAHVGLQQCVLMLSNHLPQQHNTVALLLLLLLLL
jgi:hypothetical protein